MASESQSRDRPLSPVWDALRIMSFRWFFVGRLTSYVSFQTEALAQGWLVYQLTGSALAMGSVSLGRGLAMVVFSSIGGLLCDRVPKKDVLIAARAGRFVAHVLILWLLVTGQIAVWHLILAAVWSGMMLGIMMPAEQSIIGELVPSRTLLNAVSLSIAGTAIMGTLTYLGAGAITEALGVEAAYLVVVVFHAVTLLTYLPLPRPAATGPAKSGRQGLFDGIAYARHRPALLALLATYCVWMLLSGSYRTFMPKLAGERFALDAAGLGVLLAAPQFGGMLGSLAVASLGNTPHKRRLMIGAAVAAGCGLGMFPLLGTPFAAVLILMGVGALGEIFRACNNALIQQQTDKGFRGLIMGMYILVNGLGPLGAIPAGLIADQHGVAVAVAVQGGLLVVAFAVWSLSTMGARRGTASR